MSLLHGVIPEQAEILRISSTTGPNAGFRGHDKTPAAAEKPVALVAICRIGPWAGRLQPASLRPELNLGWVVERKFRHFGHYALLDLENQHRFGVHRLSLPLAPVPVQGEYVIAGRGDRL